MDYKGLLKDLELIDLRTQAVAALYQGKGFNGFEEYVQFSHELLAFKRYVKSVIQHG